MTKGLFTFGGSCTGGDLLNLISGTSGNAGSFCLGKGGKAARRPPILVICYIGLVGIRVLSSEIILPSSFEF
jgi:hypothetical protein